MKKPLLSTLFVLASLGASAQISSGTRLREVSGVFDHQLFFYKGGYRTAQINVIPRFTWGKAVKDNTFRGWYLAPGVSFFDQGAGRDGRETYWTPSLSGGYFSRRYLRVADGLHVFGQGQIGGTAAVLLGSKASNPAEQLYQLSASASVGVTYLTKTNWGLTFGAGLVNLSLDYQRLPHNTANTTLRLNGSLSASSLSVGVTRFIGGDQAPTSVFTPKNESIYQTGQRFLGGDVNVAAPFDNSATSASVGFSRMKFKTSRTATGYRILARFNVLDQSLGSNIARTRRWGVGFALARENYLPLGSKLSLFAQTQLIFGYYGESQTVPTRNNVESHGISFLPTLSPGIQYQVSDRWAIAATVGQLLLGEASVELRKQYLQGEINSNTFIPTASFSPTYRITNSGVSLRYFPGR